MTKQILLSFILLLSLYFSAVKSYLHQLSGLKSLRYPVRNGNFQNNHDDIYKNINKNKKDDRNRNMFMSLSYDVKTFVAKADMILIIPVFKNSLPYITSKKYFDVLT